MPEESSQSSAKIPGIRFDESSSSLHIPASPKPAGGIRFEDSPSPPGGEIHIGSAPSTTKPKAAASPPSLPSTLNKRVSFVEKEERTQPEKPLPPYSGTPDDIIELLLYARSHFGSDLHIASGSTPKMRLFGDVREIPGTGKLSEESAQKMIFATMGQDAKDEYLENLDTDYSFTDEHRNRYRCNAMQTLHGSCAVFRIISNKIMSFEELGLPDSLKKIKDYKKGLVLVTGPSGCGKSTTLATFVDMVNEQEEGHILTIEDPVEILHTSKKSLVNHREVKTHTKSFARALKSALREDPDCIMIGEMRDHETISLALTAAETGHLVFGTLHTSSAMKTISRIIDVFPASEQDQIRTMLSESIQCVISQVLCKRKNGNGLIAAFEVMYGTAGIRSLVRNSKEFQIPSSIEVGMKEGMNTLDQALHKLIAKGLVDKRDITQYATRPEDFV